MVLALGQRSIGSVAEEAEPLITLVPYGNRVEEVTPSCPTPPCPPGRVRGRLQG